ncbi:MAG: asparaginase, partial [Gammaproteobacteria bacterium]|nr:asparaginase [Gammaproteobacteria bacterium]
MMKKLLKPEASKHVPLAVVTRGAAVESVHFGSIAVVDRYGNLLHRAGSSDWITFTRSACKPFQALPLVAHEGFGALRLTRREIAVICSSHSGEPRHVNAVKSILKKIDCGEKDLKCGIHTPLYYEARGKRPPGDVVFTALHNNCSGKHAGMLALCKLIGAPTHGYTDLAHPVQQRIWMALSHFSDLPRSAMEVGVDGCSVPNFAIPLRDLAYAYARFADQRTEPVYGQAHNVIYRAMAAYPEMVSGSRRLDLGLMRVGKGKWVSKAGAEAVQCVGVRSHGFGVA